MSRRTATLTGIREALPLAVPAIPFGLVLGVIIAETPEVPNLIGWLGSSFIFGGAAQLTVVTLLGTGTAVAAAVGGLVVNARHFMYSMALAPGFKAQPKWFRWLAPYVLIDQTFALVMLNDKRLEDPVGFRAYFLGAGAFFWVKWQITTGTGILLGATVPESWSLDFAVPILFLGLVVIGTTRRPAVVAALVGFAATMLFAGLPNRSGLLVGALVGVIAGVLVDREQPEVVGERTEP